MGKYLQTKPGSLESAVLEAVSPKSVEEKIQFSPKEIKMAIGVASDPRYKGGNYSGAYAAIEKIKKGLGDHPQVAAVLKRQNEEVKLDEAKDIDLKTAKIIAKIIANTKLDYTFKYYLSKDNIADIKKQGGTPPRGVGPTSGGSLYDLLKGLGDTDNDIYLDGADLVDGAKLLVSGKE